MTAYNLEIDNVFYGLWRTPEQAQGAAEEISGQSLEWNQEGFLTAFFEQTKEYRITIASDIEDVGYHLTIKAVRGWNSPTLESVIKGIGMSDGINSGFLTDLVFVPKIEKWLALYWDKSLGAEIATVEQVIVK